MNSFKDAAELDWNNSSDANEPSRAWKKATNLVNKWISECVVSELGSQEQGVLLIQMIVNILEDNITDYWSPTYKEGLLSELSEAIEMLERVRNWYDANAIRYVIRDDVDTLLAKLKR